MSLEPGGAVTSHPAVTSQPAGNGLPAAAGQPAGGVGSLALAEPAVICAGVTYRFGDHVAVDDVDLTIEPGETSYLSMSIAGVALSRDRLMGIGQAITMPLFFSSNALYPTALMPGWLQAISKVNPLSYEVDALRGLLIGVPTNLGLDVSVLVGSAVAGVVVASALLPRLAK